MHNSEKNREVFLPFMNKKRLPPQSFFFSKATAPELFIGLNNTPEKACLTMEADLV